MLTPRWDYGDEAGGWQNRTLFLGGTNHFDIYVDFEGNLRLTCGPSHNDNWHWAEAKPDGHIRVVGWADPSETWRDLFYKDRRNIETYLACFAPDWQERGLALHKGAAR